MQLIGEGTEQMAAPLEDPQADPDQDHGDAADPEDQAGMDLGRDLRERVADLLPQACRGPG